MSEELDRSDFDPTEGDDVETTPSELTPDDTSGDEDGAPESAPPAREYSDVDKHMLNVGMAELARRASEPARRDPQDKASATPATAVDEFKVELDPELFTGVDEPGKAAAAVAKAIAAAHQSASARHSAALKELEQLKATLEETRKYVDSARQQDPNEIYDALRKELGPEYTEDLKTPARSLVQGTEEHTLALTLLIKMDAYARQYELAYGKRPKMDSALARKVIAMSDGDGDALGKLYARAQRRKIKAGLDKAAKGASSPTSNRKSEGSKAQTFDELYQDAVAYAEKAAKRGG